MVGISTSWNQDISTGPSADSPQACSVACGDSAKGPVLYHCVGVWVHCVGALCGCVGVRR